MFFLFAGLLLGGFYGFLWSICVVSGEADEASMREWDRQQAEWRRDDR